MSRVTATETPVERRQRETLAACKTDAQRERVEAAYNEGKSAWTEPLNGKSLVSSAKRWFETGEPEKFSEGLYHFSMYALSEIAHFDRHGFLSVYPHPALWIDGLFLPDMEKGRIEQIEGHTLHVYKDGMTYGDVAEAISALVDEHRERLVLDFNMKARSSALAEATRLADALGMKLVPKEGGEADAS